MSNNQNERREKMKGRKYQWNDSEVDMIPPWKGLAGRPLTQCVETDRSEGIIIKIVKFVFFKKYVIIEMMKDKKCVWT